MKFTHAAQGPQMTLDVTDDEKERAKTVKKEFKVILKELEKALKVVLDLRDAIVAQHPEKTDLENKYRGRLIRYRTKIRKEFNHFLKHTKETLELLGDITDPEMIRLREILIAEIGEMSDGAEAMLDLLGETDRDSFTKTLEQLAGQMEKRRKSIEDVVESQLFNHIDHDILGRMKISQLQFNIRRRARIIRQLASEN